MKFPLGGFFAEPSFARPIGQPVNMLYLLQQGPDWCAAYA
jgi:hypothetical protein